MTGPLRRAGRALRPVYDALFGSVGEGRLRLAGTGPVVRQLAITGLVTLALLLGSALLGDLWRGGRLVALNEFEGRTFFAPAALVPVTLLALAIGWSLVLAGAGLAGVPVRLGVAAAFLLLNATIGRAQLITFEEGFVLAPVLVRGGYFAAPGALVLSCLLELWPATRRWVRPAAGAVAVASAAVLFGGLVWANVIQNESGIVSTVPLTLSGALLNAERVLIPLLLIAGIAVIEFSRDAAAAVAVPVWPAGRIAALAAVLAVAGLKLWIQLGRHLGEWAAFVSDRPLAAASTVAILGGLAGAAVRLARVPRAAPAAVDAAKERLIYVTALALAIPPLLLLAVTTAGEFLLVQLNWFDGANFVTRIPFAAIFSYADALLWPAILAAGAFVLRRAPVGSARHELALGLLLAGAWASMFFVLELFDVQLSFRAALADIVLTAGLAAYALVRRRRLGAGGIVAVGAVIGFTWLLTTQGDFIAILGGLIGLPAIAVVAFGTLFVLLADSGFASEDSRRLPRASRPLLWVGYLVVSVAILNWLAASHGEDLSQSVGPRGWFYLGLPIAVWLVVRRPFTSPEPPRAAPPAPAPEPEPVGAPAAYASAADAYASRVEPQPEA